MGRPRGTPRSTADRAIRILEAMALVVVDPARQAAEQRNARLHEAGWAEWRRRWRRVYAQCLALFTLGVVLYAGSWSLTEPRLVGLVLAGSVTVSYVLPLARLLAFFLSHAEQF